MLRKNEKLVALIREATEKHPKTSRTSLMHPLMDEIEAALANGATREGLRDALAMGGIDMPIATFNSILHRYRNKHGITKKAAPARQEKPTRPIAPVSPPSPKTVTQSPPDPDAPPETSLERLRGIMRSTPDLTELARLTKEARKDKK